MSGSRFEKMGVASWHTRDLLHQIPSTFGEVCPHSNYNLVGERPTWKLTLIVDILCILLAYVRG